MAKDIFESLGLKKNPFSMAADTEGYFHTEATKQILEELAFGITSRKGFLLLTGEVGVGKTSLLFQLLRKLESEEKEDLVTAWVFNTMLNKEELLLAIARDFGLDPPNTANVAQLIDESRLRQLRSRITIYRELVPFNKEETGRYVNFKLAAASSQFRLEKAPLNILYVATEGNTRMINLIMERALYAAVAFGDRNLSAKALRMAVSEIASCQIEVADRMNRKSRILKRWSAAAAVVLLALAVTVPYLPSEAGPQSFARVVLKKISGEERERPAEAVDVSGDRQAEGTGSAEEVGGPEGESRNSPDAGRQASVKDSDAGREEVAAVQDSRKAASANATGGAEERGAPGVLTVPGKDENNDSAGLNAENKHPDSYGEFLSKAGLAELMPEFDDAIESGKIAIFEQALPDSHQLLRLERLPSKTPVEYAAFPWKAHTGGEPDWLVIWKPAFSINDFYYGYRSEDILMLQKLLKRLGYYWGPDDGTVGPVTWRAINGFQKDMKLKRTMWPDPETVFWLTVMAKQGTASSKG